MPALAAERQRAGFSRAVPTGFSESDVRPPDTVSWANQDVHAALAPAEVLEIASRYLDARSNAERDHLLGVVLTHAANRAGGTLPAPLGRALGGLLKGVARRTLDELAPGQALGLELEGLDSHEQEFESTIRFVRLAGEAARHAVEEALTAPPHRAARAVLASAADVYAPPLLPLLLSQAAPTGEWVRRGRTIEVYGAYATAAIPSRPLGFEQFEYDPEMEYFLGGLIKSVGRAAGNVARFASKAADTVGRIPILGDVARAGIGAARLGLGPAAMAIDAGSRLARGQSSGSRTQGRSGRPGGRGARSTQVG